MHVLICANGVPAVLTPAPAADLVIAADGGARMCEPLRTRPDVLIGDLDSLTPAEVARWEDAGVTVLRYPVDKDQTDLELALHLAVERGAQRITVLGALGGRWDQSMANLLLLAHPRWRDLDVVLVDGHQRAFLVHRRGVVEGDPGDTVSLIAVASDARGVTTTGLAYPLTEGVIPFGSALGVSNRLTAPRAEIAVRQGLLLVVHIRGEHR
jgi:thiamine pyrophosphokinase